MQKRYIVIVGLVLLSMVFAACTTPTATPVTTEQPVVPTAVTTEAPPPVVEPTTVPTEVAPTEVVTLNPYIGSNKLDGNGIPPDFFADVHIRKAMNYCFDWDTVINDVYNGEAVQSVTLVLPGMPGYDLNAPHYTYDLAKCEEEFKLADANHNGVPAGEDTGDVWDTGFRFQAIYNIGNTTRQLYAEILQENLAAVNENFLVEVLGLPWPSFLRFSRTGVFPIMISGWLEDIHDPHNWFQPYTVGTYGIRQGMPDDLKAQFKDLLNKGVSLTDPAQRGEIYKQMNQLYYDQAPGIITVLPTQHAYEQKWVQGRVMNPIYCNIIYAPMSKMESAKDPTTLTVMNTGDADTFDPALAYDTASCEAIQNTYETLVFYDGEQTSKFVPMLAESWTISDDGKVYTFNIRKGVKFHEGGDLTPSDVAYSFQRGLLQGGYSSPQLLLAEPFFGVGNDDITMIIDQGASADDREALAKNDPAVLKSACETVQSAIVADDAAGTVTMTLAQPWGPFLATLANGWGSIMDKEWVIEKGGWDGSCDTWQNFYAMKSEDDPFTPLINGTGAFKLDHWTPGEEIVLAKNENFWGEPAKLDRVVIKIVPEFGTRFAALQAGDADIINVPPEYRVQVDPLVGEVQFFDYEAVTYKESQQVCTVDLKKTFMDRFATCDTPSEQPLRLYIGQPGISLTVLTLNFNIK